MNSVSVVICTRDRPDQLEPALNAILASDYRDFDLLVVDQSTTDASAALVARLAVTDSRVHLFRDRFKGASRARNIGLRETSAPLVAFTDDDCQPATDWLGLMVDALTRDATAGVVFGTVVPAPCDAKRGFIVGYAPPRRQRLNGRMSKLRDGGIGANMAFRRSALEATGGFDEMLGPGSHFPACEEGDLAYRVLRAGFALRHVPEAKVEHFGFRDWAAGSRLTRQTYLAVAAAYMKHARMGDPVAGLLLGQVLWLSMLEILGAVMRRRGPYGLGRLLGVCTGIVRSFELPIDPRRAIYLPTETRQSARARA